MNLAVKALQYLKKNGIRDTGRKAKNWYQIHFTAENDYKAFRRRNMPGMQELRRQRAYRFRHPVKFSIVVPLYRTPEPFLRALIDSVEKQTYADWELCLADGSLQEDDSQNNSPLYNVLEEYRGKDSRIRVTYLKRNEGISGNTNAALQMATGDFIVLCDHDDVLAPDALFACAYALEKDPDIEIIYSDEDKISYSGERYISPNFKPDFNPDLLCSTNYICHLLVFRKWFYEKYGGFRSAYDGAQDHDLILRYTEQADKICHIPKVLYHWRKSPASTAADPEHKRYAFENGARAVTEHYQRIGVPAEAVIGEVLGVYRTIYHWKEQPLVSVIVPNKDHPDDLRRCIRSVKEQSRYRNFEWIIVENNSEGKEIFELYEELKHRPNVQVVTWKGAFNYSAINNFGARYAHGEYLWLLNNDTKMITPDGMKDMLDICMRSDVGIVGARLYYPDDTIQHAGVIIGAGGIAGHMFIGLGRGLAGYGLRAICVQDLNAVTAACMMVKKKVFDQVGGLDEGFQVAFNDIDFCLRVREKGYLVVYDANAEFYHFESKSRGTDHTEEKRARFQSEINRFADRWKDLLIAGDPYYNPNLSIRQADFHLRVGEEKWELPVLNHSESG
ncbi:MAG: glycosyltransferase family 2 protein [Bilifractor sp.]